MSFRRGDCCEPEPCCRPACPDRTVAPLQAEFYQPFIVAGVPTPTLITANDQILPFTALGPATPSFSSSSQIVAVATPPGTSFRLPRRGLYRVSFNVTFAAITLPPSGVGEVYLSLDGVLQPQAEVAVVAAGSYGGLFLVRTTARNQLLSVRVADILGEAFGGNITIAYVGA